MTPSGRLRDVTFAALALWLVVLSFVGAGDMRSGGTTGSVTVLASWTGGEEKGFRTVLDEFTRKTHIQVDYQGTTALREVLVSGLESGTAPDVAVLPTPGELAEYAARDELFALSRDVVSQEQRNAYPPFRMRGPGASDLGPGSSDPIYWIPVKSDLKSIVWYDTERYKRDDLLQRTWPGSEWCTGLGAESVSGWPGTDWIEDLLLQRYGMGFYEKWATGRGAWNSEELKAVWRSWGDLFADGDVAAEALKRHYREADERLFDSDHACSVEHGASFQLADRQPDDLADFIPSGELLPGASGKSAAYEVSGDYAAMFHDTPQAKQLMHFLASPSALETWAEQTKPNEAVSFRANSEVDTEISDPVARRIATQLTSRENLCLDASDAMPPRMRIAFQHAVLVFLSDPRQDPALLLNPLEELRIELRDDTDTAWLAGVCTPSSD